MEFGTFYDIAEYGNGAWKGNFSSKEVACNAYDYLCEYNVSKENGEPTFVIKELYKLLIEDGTEQCLDWAYELAHRLGLIDMDYMDYAETDKELLRKILES